MEHGSNGAPSPSNLEDDEYFNLGSYHRRISTHNSQAQRWFNRGIVWAYGFNMREAAECFERVIVADPDCAMGYWGLAYTRGPYYNKPWRLFDPKERETALQITYKASRQALERAGNAKPSERALIEAMAERYPQSSPPETGDYTTWNLGYARAMHEVWSRYDRDLDIAVLYADSLMQLTPWALWDPYTGEPAPGSRALDAKAVADQAFSLPAAEEHPGLLHLYIHLMEMTRNPELAVNAADRLRHLVPDAGHLRHMPSHIDLLVGDYQAAIAANLRAVEADGLYLQKTGSMNLYTVYRVHDYHSLIYAAMLCGQSKIALENCMAMEKSLPEALLAVQSPPMADWLEFFVSVRAHVYIRFGMWQQILELQMPKDQTLYCVTTATYHYAKGIAWAAIGEVAEAEKEQKFFLQAQSRIPSSRHDFPNKVEDELRVAEAMLAGEIEYRRGNFEIAFQHLRRSIHLDDSLGYSEPWGWMLPTRHAYAALLLEQGHIEEAANAYAEDLGLTNNLPRGHQHPNNVWALHGYRECLILLGRDAEANQLELPLKLAISQADIPIESSCFCRNSGPERSQHAGTSCRAGKPCL